jgi:PPOX class probable F420-dependent enzyme
MTAMSDAQVEGFLAEARIAKLATLNADGSPNVVPVWFEWDGAQARVFTSKKSPKVERIRADNRVALSVEEPLRVPEAWVTIEGRAAIENEGGIELATRLARRYYTPAKAEEAISDWSQIAGALCVIVITPSRIRSSAPGST